MKKLLSILSLMVLSVVLYAQTPQSFSYQTVIRDAGWNVLANQSVGIEISILEDAINGTSVYKEEHASTTSQIGLVNLAVGEGTVVSGDFTTIDWGNHTYFIQVAVDVTGGTNYQVMGTTQLRSVPYALYAETSGNPGPQGPIGLTGPQGATGPQGPAGPMSTAVIDSLALVVSTLDSLMQIITPFFGCTDPTSCNYDSTAVIDNGSCIGLLGCTDNQSSNYNASATCDDGTCIPYVGMYAFGGVVYHIDNYSTYSIARIINISHEDFIGTHMSSMYATAAAVTTNGYTDWEAPTLSEIQNVCSNQSLISIVANLNGGMPLVDDYYLTSDQWCTVSNQPKAEPYYISGSSSCSYSSPPPGCPGITYKLRTVREHTF